MKIVIDGRVFSTTASNRGMGNYVRNLIQILSEEGIDLSFIGFQMTVKEFEEKVNLFPIKDSQFVNLDLNPNEVSDSTRVSTVTSQIESAIYKLQGDLFLDATPFISPSRIDIKIVPIIVVLYDLIPLMLKEQYLYNYEILTQYQMALRNVKNADLTICISKSVAELASEWLGVPPEKVEVIYPDSRELNSPDAELLPTAREYGLLMGGVHASKNPQQIHDFCARIQSLINEGELVILFPNKGDARIFESMFGSLSHRIKIYECVSESEKFNLIRNAKVFLNLSLVEGFGIPIQEAIQSGIPVISIDTELNREMKLEYELVSEPYLVDQIATRFILRLRMPRVMPRIEATGTDDILSKKLLKSLTELNLKQEKFEEVVNIVSPLSPIPCGISELSSEMLSYLGSQNIKAAAYIDDQFLPTLIYSEGLRFYSVESFGLHSPSAPSWFQLGGASWFTGVFRALQHQGVTQKYGFVHDLNISGGLYDICRVGRLKSFWNRVNSLEKNSVTFSGFPTTMRSFDFPLLAWMEEYFVKVFSHLPENSWPKNIRTSNWQYIPQGREYFPLHLKTLFNFASPYLVNFSDFNLGIFGSILPNKKIETVIEGIRSLDQELHLHIVGRAPDKAYLSQLIEFVQNMNLASRVHFVVDPSDEGFLGIMSRIDLVVSLRDNKIGQISGPILQALSLGVPVLIEKSAYWSDLVSDAPYSLPTDVAINDVAETVKMFQKNPDALNQLRDWSRKKYIKNSIEFMTNLCLESSIEP